ncbi:hypothetical protein L1286_17270 [Pseudoalteromonas sp. SMS1]|uniref:hypothetical protein n=1 Tax=Pseudoalteromonas sp. SMS1 TaxID=2908894 RepID=UPI001F33AA4A|nr:hypothetical protein [Pseudoalteromonas sp. SMS1]MCF2859237.1 hypothetical protein [Pseudoalteromonas sp. SMS1]
MSKAKKRIRWRRVRILKPYNYYFHAGTKAHLGQTVVAQPINSACVADTGAEPARHVDSYAAVAPASAPACPQGENETTIEARLGTHVEEIASEAPEESPLAVFEPGQNPYVFYLQQVPVMLTSLPQEVAVPVESSKEPIVELEPIERTAAVLTAQPCEEPQLDEAPQLFWSIPKWARAQSKSQRQGVKSPHVMDLPVRFGGNVMRQHYHSEFVEAIDNQLRPHTCHLMTLSALLHTPHTLSTWLTQLPFTHLCRLLTGLGEQNSENTSLAHLLSDVLSREANSVLNEAQLAAQLLTYMKDVVQHDFHGTAEQFINLLLTQCSMTSWILLRQNTMPLLCEPMSSLVMSAPWSVSAHLDHLVAWEKPIEVIMFTLPEGIGKCLSAHSQMLEKQWQPYLTMSLLEFMYSQQSLPRSPNF